jgi:hypothetical protein
MGEPSSSVIAAIDRVAREVGENRNNLIDALNRVATSLGDALQVPQAAKSDPREEVLIRYTVGTGEFSDDMRFNVLRMRMFMMNGEPDGTHDGVWEPLLPPMELYQRPNPPQGPLDRPEGPIDHIPIRAYTKAIWRFGDGSSVTAVGPANLHLVRFTDESQIFLVSVAAIITNGSGKYQGAYGVKTALGSTFVPRGTDIFNLPPGTRFGAVTVETFRIIRAGDVRP